MTPMPITCEVVEDYRSSTAFDALGSIGGLFAILQGVHLLLFGRPLFWGIAGRCSSQGFRQRLREHYQVSPAEPAGESRHEDTLRITSFLKDFVIDFGPADFEETDRRRSMDCTASSVEKDEDTELGSQVQLLPAFAFQSISLENNSSAD
ncbi:hypothetical protein FRC07_003840, partial [Ceratobasidium sp. 392]